jgi:hypothetical protein
LHTNLAKKVITDATERDQQIKDAGQSCSSDITDQEIAKSTYEMWADARYKVIYKIRVTDATDTANYSEIGQKYDGSNTLHFFMNSASKDATSGTPSTSTAAATFDLNTSAATIAAGINLNGSGDGTSESDAYSFKATVNSKPYQGSINAAAPSDATSIMDILQGLFDSPDLTSNAL